MKWRIIPLFIMLAAHTPNAYAFSMDWFDPNYYLQESGIAYDIAIKGIEEEIADRYDFPTIAQEAIDPTNPPLDADELMAISGTMAERITNFLQAEGYYDAYVRSSVSQPSAQDAPLLVTFDIKLLRPYHFTTHEMHWVNPPSIPEDITRTFPNTIKRHGLVQDAPLRNEAIISAAKEIERRLKKGRCFLALTVTPRLLLDRVTQHAQVQFRITHEQEVNFGKAHFTGDSTVTPETLAHYLTWKQGECFTTKKIDGSTSQLLQSRLLARATITPDAEKVQNGEIPINIEVKDRPHRTFTAGGYYATDEGVGTRLGWEHRNLEGKAHRLTSRLAYTGREKSLIGQYTIPFFLRQEQNLQLSSSVKQEETNAFDSTNIAALAAIERYLINPTWLVGAGVGVRIADITDVRGQEKFGFLYAPAFMQWDSRNDLFDATEGIFARGSITPYSDMTGQGVYFLKSDITVQHYVSLNTLYHDYLSDAIPTSDEEEDGMADELFPYAPVFAFRVSYGQINGASRADVPADLRFYAGGGGSVRGYNFQAIGERQAGLPAGGTVKTEINAELRLRFDEQFGGVLFMDAGSIYTGDIFNPSEPLFFALGTGVRYYSPIGPIRFDVGVPLQTVEDKANFGVYISIGQAF